MALRQLDIVATGEDDLDLGEHEDRVLHHWHVAAGDDARLHSLILRAEHVEGVVERVHDLERVQVVVTRALESCLPDVDELEEDDEVKDEPEPLFARVSREELRERMDKDSAIDGPFIVLVVASTIVAAVGLAMDNTAVVIGAMVIAPLVGPNLLLALSTALVDWRLGVRAALVNGAGSGGAFLLSLLVGLVMSVNPEVGEIAIRTQVSLADVALALAAGTAGALSVTRAVDSALIGVMVAAALLPPVVVSGMLLGSGDVDGAAGAGLLFAVNLVCVNLAAVATFALLGLKPRLWQDRQDAAWVVPTAVGIWVALLLTFVSLMAWLRGWAILIWPGAGG
mgnify:CR=1 FL=1